MIQAGPFTDLNTFLLTLCGLLLLRRLALTRCATLGGFCVLLRLSLVEFYTEDVKTGEGQTTAPQESLKSYRLLLVLTGHVYKLTLSGSEGNDE